MPCHSLSSRPTSIPTMAFYRQPCNYGRPLLPCEVTCPQPYTNACSQPCITSCGDSRAIVCPPPVVITFPGPILSSCPQESIVGSSAPLGLDQPRGLQGSTIYGSSLSSFQQGRSQRYRDCRPC